MQVAEFQSPQSPGSAPSNASGPEPVFVFGRFQLSPRRQELLEDGQPLRLGSRALELLILLVEQAGNMVDKAALIGRAWPDTIVEEINLRVQVTALRKALGDGQNGNRFIITIPGRGYSFVAPVTRLAGSSPATRQDAPNNLPRRATRLVGRQATLAALQAQIKSRRFVTVVGPGGMGKTSLALAVAESLLHQQRDGVYFVDLSPLSDPNGIAGAVAAAMQLALNESHTLARLSEAIAGRELLIVLDNCEHLADAAAELAELLLQASDGLLLLTTSREPLRARGEWLHRVAPLELPNEDEVPKQVTAEQAMAWPAVQLLVERAHASLDGFVLKDEDAGAAIALCRHLDGLPLAIELAAARIDTLGIRGLAEQIEHRFELLTSGLRTVQPRQRNLRALLDWSHALLSPTHQRVMRRLAIFRGAFSLEEAVDVIADDLLDVPQAIEGIVALADRSLLSTDMQSDVVCYRMLELTRAYAQQKLQESGEAREVSLRLVQGLLTHYARSEADWTSMPRTRWLAQHGRRTEDLRFGLDWAFGPDGQLELGVKLTAAAAPLAFELAVLHDFRARVERAITALESLEGDWRSEASRLQTALGSLYNHVLGPSEQMSQAYRRAHDLAGRATEAKAVTPAIVGLWAQSYAAGDYPTALDWARQLKETARGSHDEIAELIADRMRAQSLHMLGDHAKARQLAERVLRHPQGRFPLAYGPSQTSVHITMRIVLARIEWLEGRPHRAQELVEEALEISDDEHVYGECLVVAMAACPIALWSGDLDAAQAHTERLRELVRQYPSPYWHAWAVGYAFALEPNGPAPAYDAKRYDALVTLRPSLWDPRTQARVDSGQVGWCAAEVMRVRALTLAEHDLDAAEKTLRQALELARRQGATAWELRCATSLAKLLTGARAAEGQVLLAAVRARMPKELASSERLALEGRC